MMAILLIIQVSNNQQLSKKFQSSSENVESADIMLAELASLYIAMTYFADDTLADYDKD